MKNFILYFTFFCLLFLGKNGLLWGQISEGFESTTTPATGWTYTSVTHGTTNPRTPSRCVTFNGTNDAIITPLISNPNILTFYWRRSGTTPATPNFLVQTSSNVGGPWTTISGGSITSFTTSYQTFTANLSSFTNIYVRVLDNRASGTNEIYIDDFSIDLVPATFTSTLSTGAGSEPSGISSLINTQASSILNFDFNFNDDGATPATDATDTQISQIVFNQGTGNDIADWTQAILGAELSDGTNTTTSATINATNITFGSLPNGAGQIGRITDNATKTYTLKIWLKTSLGGILPATIDGLNLVFQVTNTSFTFAGGGLIASQSVNSGNTNNAISVVSTQMSFVQQPPSNSLVNAAMSPAVTVQATDINGNRDLNFTNNISITSTGVLDSSPQISTASSGLANFGAITHTALGIGLTLTASSVGLSNITSTSFNITNVSGTFLNPGDIVIVGFDSQETNSGAEDGVYFMNMVDILPNTTFSYVNSRFEACAPANTRTMRWGGSGNDPYEDPGVISFTWNGTSNITKGSVIKMRATTSVASIIMEINGVTKTSDFTITSITSIFPNISSSDPDQMYIVQGTFTPYGVVVVSRYNLFEGRVLFGFTNGASWVPFNTAVSCNTNGTGREGRLHPDLRCFNIENATRRDAMYYKTANISSTFLQTGTKRELLGKIKDVTNNWIVTTNSNIPNSRKTTTFTINTGKTDGTWVGDVSTNWFDCANWEGLTVPDNTIDVTVENYSPYTNRANIDFTATYSDEFQDIAQCKNLSVTNRSVSLEGNINDRLDVYSNINISGTGQIDMNDANNTTNDGTINLYGNFTNQLANGLDEGNGTFNFIGSSEQTIQNTAGNESFYRINVNKSGDVKLLSNINLTSYSATNNGRITLTQSDINLNGNNIDLGSDGTLSENLGANHLIKDNTATFDKGAGVGVSGGYVRTSAKTISTSNNTMAGIGLNLLRSAGSDYTVEVDRFHYSGWTSTRTVKRIFHIKTTTGTEVGTNSTLKMFFADDELNGLNNATDGVLAAWRLPSGTAWAYHPAASVSHNALARTIEASSVNGFSHWAMTPPNIPLSSCVLDFQAQKIETHTAKLFWKVILQDNPEKFEVQKSLDGLHFTTIATLDATQSPQYVLNDYQLLQSSYYRLKIFKASGEIELSPIRYIRIENGLIIYPNPVGNFIKIEGKNIDFCAIRLSEVSGKILLDNRGNLS